MSISSSLTEASNFSSILQPILIASTWPFFFLPPLFGCCGCGDWSAISYNLLLLRFDITAVLPRLRVFSSSPVFTGVHAGSESESPSSSISYGSVVTGWPSSDFGFSFAFLRLLSRSGNCWDSTVFFPSWQRGHQKQKKTKQIF